MNRLYRVEKDGAIVVTTASGWEVECQPVADLLLRVGQNLVEPEAPEPPTYTVTGAGGETEERTYDQEAIDDPKTPEEDQVLWQAYLIEKRDYDAAMAAVEQKRNELRGRFMALRGVKVRGLPTDLETWAAEQQTLFGFEVEDDGLPHDAALQLAFIDQHVIRTQADGAKVTAGIMRASGLAQEALDSVEATFLDSLGYTDGADAERDPGVPGETEPAES
jgi:hypothetical protein